MPDTRKRFRMTVFLGCQYAPDAALDQ